MIQRTSTEEGSNEKFGLKLRRFKGDPQLLAAAEGAAATHKKGRVVRGTIGSGEVWDSELDRIRHFHKSFGTSIEEMEGASAAQLSGFHDIPFLGIRILSNNITNGDKYDPKTAEACQDFVYEVVRAYIRTLK